MLKPRPWTKKEFERSYLISSTADAIDNGKTPLSKTQMTKLLQRIFDAVIGQDVLKATTFDLAYVYNLMNKRGGSGIIVSPKVSYMETLIMDVMHKTLEKKNYVVQYAKRKDGTDAVIGAHVELANDENADGVNGENTDTTNDENAGNA